MKVRFMNLVSDKKEKMGPIAQFDSNGFVFVAELMNCDASSFEDGKEYEADVKFYCHKIYVIYKNEEEFHKDHSSIAEQSYFPVGSFPANPDKKDWEPSPINIINSIVDEVVDNEIIDAPDNLVLFYGKLYENTVDQALYYESAEEKDDVQAGYIVSGLYWAELILETESGEDIKIC